MMNTDQLAGNDAARDEFVQTNQEFVQDDELPEDQEESDQEYSDSERSYSGRT